MALPIRFRRIAAAEMAEAQAWYEVQRPGLGKQFLQEVSCCLDRIADHPERYPLIDHLHREAILEKFPFCIYFKVRDQKIIVLAVFHTSRNPEQWQERQ